MKTNQENNDVNEKGTDLKVNINTEKKYIVFPKDFALFSLGGLLFFDCCLIEILYNCYMPFLRHNALFENLLLFLSTRDHFFTNKTDQQHQEVILCNPILQSQQCFCWL